MEKIKGILINPEKKTIEEIEFVSELNEYYKILECDCIDAVSYDNEHDFVIDDEALFKYPSIGFRKEGLDINHGLFGKSLIVGVVDGKWVSHKLNIEDVKKEIEFFSILTFEGKHVVINEGKAE